MSEGVVGFTSEFEEVDEGGFVGGRDFRNGVAVEFDFGEAGVVCAFDGDGRKEDEAGTGVNAFELVEVIGVLLFKIVESGFSGERFVESVSEHDGLGRPLGEEVLHVLGVTFETEAVAHFVARPGEAADFELLVGDGDLEAGFQLTVFEEAFHHGVSVEEDGVVAGAGCGFGTGLEGFDFGVGGGDGLARGPEDSVDHDAHGLRDGEVSEVTKGGGEGATAPFV